jgi:RND superfamily putative drug exporter
VLYRISGLAIASPRRVIVWAVLVMIGAATFGIPVLKSLSAGGDLDPSAESSKASALLSQKFDQGDMSMVITVSYPGGAKQPEARTVGTDLVVRLQNSAKVREVRSGWTVPPDAASTFFSKDGKTGLIVAAIAGGESNAALNAKQLSDELVHDRNGVAVRAGGDATVNWQVNAQTQKDLLLMESVALPLSFLVLVWVFGGLVAAALPVAVGVFAILGSLASLRVISLFTDVSIFALNLAVAMGMALAVDYTLLILSRFRDELAQGQTRDAALIRTMATAGRTVLFSAMTVALSMATMVLFPQYFLKSFAYAGTAVVAFAAAAAVIVTPAAIKLLDRRLDSWDVRPLTRRILWGSVGRPSRSERWSWYRWTKFVMRHAVPTGLAVIAVLLLLGSPFHRARWGFADDRILPTSASARQVGDQLRNNFSDRGSPDITVVLPDVANLSPAELDAYAAALSRVPDVKWVSGLGGTFVDGGRFGPASAPYGLRDGSAFLTVGTNAPLYTTASTTQLDRLHAVAAPRSRTAWLTGVAQGNRDSVHAIASRLPWVFALIAVITLVLIFLLTGSVVLPVKAILMNTLSLTAAFGALVWVFQEGHLGGLGTAATGTLGVQLPVLLFCIAFGLSMDYEVFLISRIREYWLASEFGPQANDESVALGLAHTARVITAAALIMAISFSALMAAQVSFMRLFGFGLTVAVVADATLVRMLLVPAFMHVLGRINWWAPKSLARLHDRIGFSESDAGPSTAAQGQRKNLARISRRWSKP